MDRRTAQANIRAYEDFSPSSSFSQEEKSDTLVINLPGFTKEQIRVQIDSFGNLKVTGERPLGSNNRWSRFRKDVRIPSNSNASEIRAKFENGVLNIIMPKKVPEVQNKPAPPSSQVAAPPTGQKLPPTMATPGQKPITESKVPPPPPLPPSQKPSTESLRPPTPVPSQKTNSGSKFSPTPQAPPSQKRVTESSKVSPTPQAPEANISPANVPQPSQKPRTQSLKTPTNDPQQSQYPTSTGNDTTRPSPQPHPSHETTQTKKRFNNPKDLYNSAAHATNELLEKIWKGNEDDNKEKLMDNSEKMNAKESRTDNKSSQGHGSGSTMADYKNQIEMLLKEPRSQLVVNMVVASIVVVGLTVYTTWTFK